MGQTPVLRADEGQVVGGVDTLSHKDPSRNGSSLGLGVRMPGFRLITAPCGLHLKLQSLDCKQKNSVRVFIFP
jgi:hypothetical protein